MTTAELEANLAMLRKQNVKQYTDIAGGGFTVEFFPAQPVEDKPKPSNDPDICACKHPEHAHMNGYCVEGCETSVCNPPEPKA